MKAENLSGKRVRLILNNNFHYSGVVVCEDEFFIILIDKFSKEVRLSKNSILSLEVLGDEFEGGPE